MSKHNSYDLIEHVYQLLRQHSDGLSEYALLQLLAQHDPASWSRASANTDLTLFRQHFLLFHSLYSLRERLWRQCSANLEIDPMHIRLLPYQSGSQALSQRDPVRDYYMDLSHLHP